MRARECVLKATMYFPSCSVLWFYVCVSGCQVHILVISATKKASERQMTATSFCFSQIFFISMGKEGGRSSLRGKSWCCRLVRPKPRHGSSGALCVSGDLCVDHIDFVRPEQQQRTTAVALGQTQSVSVGDDTKPAKSSSMGESLAGSVMMLGGTKGVPPLQLPCAYSLA